MALSSDKLVFASAAHVVRGAGSLRWRWRVCLAIAGCIGHMMASGQCRAEDPAAATAASDPDPAHFKIFPNLDPFSDEPGSKNADSASDANSSKKVSGAKSSEGSNSEVLPLRQPPGLFKEEPKPQEPTGTARKLEWVELLSTPRQVPIGFSGPSGIANWEGQEGDDFVPEPDRWRSGFPDWDRYGPDHHVLCPNDPFEEDAPYAKGWLLNPYRQNVLKGDYPIIGQHTFLNITAESFSDFEYRQVPTPTTPFESPPDPFTQEFFGNPDQFALRQNFSLSFDLLHGDAAFKPVDWRIQVTPIFNLNYLDVNELGVVSPNVLDGTDRFRTYASLEEWFAEAKIADTSPDYDFVSRPRRFAAVCERLPRLHFRGHQSRRAPLRHGQFESRSVQRGRVRPAGERHQQRAEHVSRSRSDHGDRQLLSAGLHLAGLHDAAQHPLQPRQRQRAGV